MRKSSLLVASVVLGVAAWAMPAGAQSSLDDQRLMFDTSTMRKSVPAQAPAKPSRPAKVQASKVHAPKAATRAAAPQPVTASQDTQPLPRLGPAKEAPQPAPRTLGRIPFETGSIGLSTDRRYSNTAFSDGRVTPGFENIQTKSPSYFGLSLSVPTDKTSIPLPPLFARPD